MRKSNVLTKTLVAIIVIILGIGPTVAAASRPTVGLVLGGGAARGFSHIGLIKAMEEQGIPIDLLVGTSMGSIVASLYAAGYSVENMETIIDSLNLSQLVDIAVPPKGGLVNTTKILYYLDTLLEGKHFSDLTIPFYSVITELRTGTEVALNEGPVSRGVQASMSIPALFPAVEIDGRYYVDGGMKNAVPANVAKDHGADVVIAVDVKKDLEEVDYDSILNNLQLTLWFMIDGYVELNTADADVIIVPDVMFDSYMSFQKADYFINQGYSSGLAYIEQIKEAILAHDPNFEFIPYSQPGYSEHEVEQVIREAQKAVAQIAPPLSIMPEFKLDQPVAMGLSMSGGPLGWWKGGYRYWFGDENGHEGFFGWKRPGIGSITLGIRTSSAWDGLAYRWELATAPLGGTTTIKAVYQTEGQERWSLSAHNPRLLSTGRLAMGINAELGQKRLPEEQIFLRLEPIVKIYPTADYVPVLEAALVRPYFYAGIDWEYTANSHDALDIHGGLGSEILLFGLYPLEMRLGLERTHTAETKLKVGLVGGSF